MFKKLVYSANSIKRILDILVKVVNSKTMEDIFSKETSYLFNPDSYRDAGGHLNAVLVFKITRFDLYNEKVKDKAARRNSAEDLADMKKGHDEHMACLKKIRGCLKELDINFTECLREDVSSEALKDKVVITVGGDGTLLEASHHIKKDPVFAVNSDPGRSVGSLCISKVDSFKDLMKKMLDGKLLVQKIVRIKGLINGKKVCRLALNEVLVTHENPAAMSRYSLELRGQAEFQRSSGVWIGAPAGSSGAVASAGGKTQSVHDQHLQLIVREPYFAGKAVPKFLREVVPADEKLVFTSQMHDGQVYFDGHHEKEPFGLGTKLELEGNGEPLHLFITKEMEIRRLKIGQERSSLHSHIV